MKAATGPYPGAGKQKLSFCTRAMKGQEMDKHVFFTINDDCIHFTVANGPNGSNPGNDTSVLECTINFCLKKGVKSIKLRDNHSPKEVDKLQRLMEEFSSGINKLDNMLKDAEKKMRAAHN